MAEDYEWMTGTPKQVQRMNAPAAQWRQQTLSLKQQVRERDQMIACIRQQQGRD